MADMPAPLQYGKVVGYFGALLPDADVGESAPDLGAVTGTVVITPNLTPKIARATGLTPARIVTLPSYTCTINATGEMYGPDGEPSVNVVAGNSAGLSPQFQYRAKITLAGVAPSDQPAELFFNVNANTTVNLTNIVSVSQPGILVVVSEESRLAAEAAAASLRRGVAGGVAALDDLGRVINADGSLPSGGSGGGNVPNATTTVTGIVRLAGDLSGTATAPVVNGMLRLANTPQTVLGAITFAQPILVGTPTTATHAATKAYVDGVAGSGTVPDADLSNKGKLRLAGDLAGTADTPVVVGMLRLADLSQSVLGSITFAKSPVVPVATLSTHAVQKLYVDNALTALRVDTALSGNPTAPTQTTGNSSTRLATTEFVAAALTSLLGSSAFNVALTNFLNTAAHNNYLANTWGLQPRISYDTVNSQWPASKPSINGYTGDWDFDSMGTLGVSRPTLMEAGDDWWEEIS